jgi:hypothetical protein
MKPIRNIEVSEKANHGIQQGESCFKYLVVGFLALCWLCRTVDNDLLPVEIHKWPVAAVGNKPVYHTEPGQDASTLNLILDWFRTDGSNE